MDETSTDIASLAMEISTNLRPVGEPFSGNQGTDIIGEALSSTYNAYSRELLEGLMSSMPSTIVDSNRLTGTVGTGTERTIWPYSRRDLTNLRFNTENPSPPPPLERIRIRPEQEVNSPDFDGGMSPNTLRVGRISSLGIGENDNITIRGNLNTSPVTISEEGSINRGWTTTVSRDSIYGDWNINEGNLHVKSDNLGFFERNLIKFLKEKLSINISVNNAGPGIEVKVSLNLVETGEEILSDIDYLKMN